MMTEVETDQPQPVTCYHCDKPILPGEGRYHVFLGEAYCSWVCFQQTLPHIAEAIELFAREPLSRVV